MAMPENTEHVKFVQNIIDVALVFLMLTLNRISLIVLRFPLLTLNNQIPVGIQTFVYHAN